MNKRCGLPLALPLHAKKLCPNLPFSRRFGHRVLVWKTGKKPSRFCRSTSAAGVGYALRYREIPPDRKIRKSGHGRDGHVRFFLPAAFRQRKLCRDTACLPRLQRRSAAGALGRTPFPDRLKGHAAAFSRSPALRGPFGKKETRESHRPAGCHRIDGEEDPSLRRRLRYRQQGQWPPVSHCFFRSRFPGYRRPGPRPHRRRGRPWRNDGYGAA